MSNTYLIILYYFFEKPETGRNKDEKYTNKGKSIHTHDSNV